LSRWFVGSGNGKRSRRAGESERAGKSRGERHRFINGHSCDGIRVTGQLESVGGARGRRNPQRGQNPQVAVVRMEEAGSWRRWRGRTTPRARAGSLCRVDLTGQIGGGFGPAPVEVASSLFRLVARSVPVDRAHLTISTDFLIIQLIQTCKI
jgi:hypothetical protein